MLLCATGLLITATDTLAQAGAVDPSFTVGPAGVPIQKVAVQSDGRILVGGSFTDYGGSAINSIVRLETNGAMDPSWNPGAGLVQTDIVPGLFTNVAPGQVSVLVAQPDGTILVGGGFNSAGGLAKTNLARFNSSGSVDTGFNASAEGGLVLSILRLDNGKLLVGGGFTKIGGVARPGIALLNADGTVDGSFVPNLGIYFGGQTRAIGVQSDGRILIAGAFATLSGGLRYVAALRLNTDGSFDGGFTPPSLSSSLQAVTGAVIQPDGKIVLSGTFATLNSVSHVGIARLNTDGSLDPGWPGAGVNAVNSAGRSVAAMVAQPDGKILIGGPFEQYNGENIKGIARLNADGSRDTTFSSPATSTFSVTMMALQSDGNVVLGGIFTLGTTGTGLIRVLGGGAGTLAPVITVQPANRTVIEGDPSVTFSIQVAGTPPFTYQWYKDGVALTDISFGAYSDTLLVRSRPVDAGTYTCAVTNSAGSDTSDPVTLTVLVKPTITAQPAPVTVNDGQNASFSVTADGTPPLSYQWFRNNVAIPGANAATFSLTPARLSDAGDYQVVVTNAAGSIDSTEVALTVNAIAPTVTLQPVSQSVQLGAAITNGQCAGYSAAVLPGAVFSMTVSSGAAPFANSGSYQVRLRGTGNIYELTGNGINPARTNTWSFAPDLGTADVLWLNDYFGDGRAAKIALLADCTYELYSDGLVSSQGGTYFVTGGTVIPPTNVTFAVEAAGTGPLTYQWKRNDVAIPGATASTLTITNVTRADLGSYVCAVTGPGGTVNSLPALLSEQTTPTGPTLTFTLQAGNILHIDVPAGFKLQTATALGGGWSDVPGNPPFDLPTTAAQAFYRLSQ